MTNFIIGVIVGIVLATVGGQGVANMATSGMATIQSLASTAAQPGPVEKR